MSETELTVLLSGDAQKREETPNGVVETSIVSLEARNSFTKPTEFHRFACKKRDATKAEAVLPDEYFLRADSRQSWRATLSSNAVEIAEFAEAVAEEQEESSVIDVLTLWLQSFDSMRIRRALHEKLDDAGVAVSRVD